MSSWQVEASRSTADWAIVDRLTFGGNIIETGTDSYRLAAARAAQQAPARPKKQPAPAIAGETPLFGQGQS